MMKSCALIALTVLVAVMAAPPPQQQHQRDQDQPNAPMSLDDRARSEIQRIGQIDMSERSMAMELTKQGVVNMELEKAIDSLSKQVDKITKTAERARRDLPQIDSIHGADSKAEKLDAMKEKSQIEKTERALSKSTEHVDQLQNNVDTMSKQLQKAELSSKEANEHVDTLKEHTSELTQQVDTLKKQGEEVRAVANELRKTVAKDVRRRRDTTLNAVDHLAETLSAKADELVTKADQVKDNIEEVKKSAEKVSSATEQATREIREDSAEVSAISKDLTEHKTENMKVIEATKAVLEKTAEHINDKTADLDAAEKAEKAENFEKHNGQLDWD